MRFAQQGAQFALRLLPAIAFSASVFAALSDNKAALSKALGPEADLTKQISAAKSEAAAKPHDPRVLLRLAALYHQQGNFQKSLPLLERLTALEPTNLAAQRLLGVDRFHAGHTSEALQALKKVLDASPKDSEANFYLGLCYLSLDRDNEADKAFDRLAALAPADLDELYLLTKAYTRVSAAMLSRLSSLGEHSYRMHQVRGEYFDLQNAPEQAIKEYEKAVEIRPDLPSLHYVLGSAYWKRSQLDKAAAEFERVIGLSPRHFMARYKLGTVLLEQNNAPRAIQEFRATLDQQPGFVDAYLGLAKALFQEGEYDAAVPQLQRYIQFAPDNPTPHYLLYQIYRRLNKPEDAERELAVFKEEDQKAREKKNRQMGGKVDIPDGP